MAGKNESKKELAYLLYMQGIKLEEIRDRCGIGSSRTLNNWIKEGGWKEKRAAKTITRTELITKTLAKINDLLESETFEADKLSKLAALIEKLDRQNSPIVVMDVLMDFGRFLSDRSNLDRDIDLPFLKKVNRYQDMFISQKLNA